MILRIISSLKTELKVVFISLAGILLLPALAVLAIAGSGIEPVSKALAAVNPVTRQVEVRDPNGNVIALLDATTVWPTNGIITQEFGVPNPPYETHHTGIDVAGKSGDPITTFMAGKVTQAGAMPGGCGLCVTVDHGNNITSSYLHMSRVNAKEGQEVKPGDVIGYQGTTGWSTGVHLHFMVKVYGVPVDPRVFMVGEPSPGAD